jgi:hypothetical protein
MKLSIDKLLISLFILTVLLSPACGGSGGDPGGRADASDDDASDDDIVTDDGRRCD